MVIFLTRTAYCCKIHYGNDAIITKIQIKMLEFSQNKKIAISAVAMFVVSLSTMVFFLGGNIEGGADVLGANSSHNESESDVVENSFSFTTDVGGNITAASTDFCSLINKSCDLIVKKSLYKFVNKEDVSDLAAVFGKLAQKAQIIDSIGPIRVSGDVSKGKLVILKAQSMESDKGKNKKVENIKFWVKDITDKVDGEKNVEAKPSEESEEAQDWMQNIYPKIREMHEQGNKLLVKISKT